MPRSTSARTCRLSLLLALAVAATTGGVLAAPGVSAAPRTLERVDSAVTVTRVGPVPAPVVDPLVARATTGARATTPPVSTWQVRWTGSMGDAARTDRAKAAVQAAVDAWSRTVRSVVPIVVEVDFAPTEDGVLGYTGASSHYRAGWIGDGASSYPSPLADALAGEDVALLTEPDGPDSDIQVTISSSEPGYYFGTDGRPPAGTLDLETVALHEIAHGLGFAGTMYVDDTGGHPWTSWPAVYDKHTAAPAGRVLGLTGDPRVLGDALTGRALTWTGAEAVAANGGRPVRLFAPGTWEEGSSYSHLDEATYPTGSANALLTPYVSANEVLTAPGPLALGMLRDMGWSTVAPPVSPIDARYAAEPGLRAVLGAPVGDEQSDGDLRWRVYERGRLYASAAGVRAVHGQILARYLALGGHRALGAPTTDEQATADGAARFNHFARGASLYWRPSTGAYPLLGAIRQAWAASGGEAGPLGYPLNGESATADGIGRFNDFSKGGSVYWTAATDAHVVYGAIKARWLAYGGPGGPLGYPVTDETAGPAGSRFNDFSKGGSVYWSEQTGAHAVHGLIRALWLQTGGAAVLGLPTTDETVAPDGVGRYNDFSAGATVTWSPRTGAHEVHGAIRTAWLQTGALAGPLGYPVTTERVTADQAGRYNDFSGSGGSVYWSPATGAHAVYGAIKTHWVQLGGVRSWLGYPTTSEFAVPGGRRSEFAGGSVTWTPGGGPVAVRR